MGSKRREHHRKEEAMRAANAEANRIKEIIDASDKKLEETVTALTDKMTTQTEDVVKALTPDISKTIASTVGAQNMGVRSSKSARKSASNIGKGASSLRIPLNVGGAAGTNLNIG